MALRLPSQNKAFRPSKPRPRAPTAKPAAPSQSATPGPSQPPQNATQPASSASRGPSGTSQGGATSTQDGLATQATQGPPGLTQGPTQSSQDTIIATPQNKSTRLPNVDEALDEGANGNGPKGKTGDFAVPEPRTTIQASSAQIPSSPAQTQQPVPTSPSSTPDPASSSHAPRQSASSPALPPADLATGSPSQAEASTSARPPSNAPSKSAPRRGPLPGQTTGLPVQRSRPPSAPPSASSTSASKGGRLSLLNAAKQAATSGSGKPSPGRLPSRSRSTSVRAPSVPPAVEEAVAGVTATPTTPAAPAASAAAATSTEPSGPAESTNAGDPQPSAVPPAEVGEMVDPVTTTSADAPTPPINDVTPIAGSTPPNRQEEIAASPAVTPSASRPVDEPSLPHVEPASPLVPASGPQSASDAAQPPAPEVSEASLTLAAAANSPPPPHSPARNPTDSATPLFLPDPSPSPSRASAPPASNTSAQSSSSSGRAMSATETAAAAQAILDSLVLQRNTGRPAPRAEGRRLSPKARSSPGILVTKRAYRDKTVKSQQAARKEAEANGLELPEYLQRKRKTRTRSESAPKGDDAAQGDQASEASAQKRAKKNAAVSTVDGETIDEETAIDGSQEGEVDELAEEAEEEAPAPKKKRGRPKKVVEDEDASPKEKRPRGRPRKNVEEQATEDGDVAPKEKRPRGRPRKDHTEAAKETREGAAEDGDAPPKEKRPRGRPRKSTDEEPKETGPEGRSSESKSKTEKGLPAFSQVSLVGFEPGDTIGEGVDVNLLTMADLATNIFSGQITAKGVQLDEMMQVERSNRKIRGQHNTWNGWTRAQLSRRKVRREQNLERERRRQAIRDEGRDPMGEVTEDEPDSEEEFEVTPNRYTPPPEDERIARVLPTVLGQQAGEYGAEGMPAPGDENGAGEDDGQRRRRPEGAQDDEDYEHHNEPEEEYAPMGVELRVAEDEPEDPDNALAAAGFAVADDENMGGGGGGGDGDDDDDDYDYDAMQEDGTYDLAQYHAEREAQRERDLAERENRAIIEENDDLTMINSRTYAKVVPRGMPWTEVDTMTLYMALSEVGPNSDIVTGYFPGRTRKQVNRKMVKEQRANPDKFWAAVANKREVDVEHLKISAAYDDHEDWSKEDEFLEQCRRDAEACRDDYVPPPEDEAANEEGLQQMEDENEKQDDKEDDDDYDAADVVEGEGEEDGERVVIEGYEPEEADDQQDKDDDYDYEQ